MKVLLIQPPCDFIAQAYGVKQKVSFGHAPPLGLGIIAAYLKNGGHEVSLLDAAALELTLDQTVERVKNIRPDVVGITTLTNYADSVRMLSARIKEVMPNVITVLGGPHATYFHEEILGDMAGIDHVIYGEADTVVCDYVDALENPDRLREIKGLVYRDKEGRPVVNPPAELLDDLDNVPQPAFELFDMSLYRPLPLQYRRLPFFTIITSRGCWWRRCKFCFQAGYKAVPFRRQSPERVVSEIETLYRKYGIREIAFWDDTFVQQIHWMKKFVSLLDEKDIRITWVASGKVNTITDDLIRLIHKAGCWSIFMGIESGNQDILDIIDKGITLEQARQAVAICNRVGIETRAAFMLGLPGETPEKALKTVDFAIEIDPTYAIFYATHPRRGTALYDIAFVSGKFIDQDFRGMSKVTYIPEGYQSAEQLERMIRYAYRKFYLRPRLWLKYLKRLKSRQDILELLQGFLLFMGLTKNTIEYNGGNEKRSND